MAAIGKRWCRRCGVWIDERLVTKNGLCRPHENEAYRSSYAKNPTRQRARVHARKRRISAVPDDASLVAELFDNACAYCGGPHESWDHVVPVAAGGDSTPGNIVPCCIACNSSKGSRDVWDWLSRRNSAPPVYFIEYATTLGDA